MFVNKEYSLPEDYDPGDTLPEVQEAFDRMAADAHEEGLSLYVGSGYRSYQYQERIYANYCHLYGEDYANTFSSMAGHSEHQTGYTIDCNTINDAFGYTKESQWLAKHCAEYGFIVRYPEGKDSITGYKYEPWHIRYVGVALAKDIKSTGLCLEEYLGVDDKVYETKEDLSRAAVAEENADV